MLYVPKNQTWKENGFKYQLRNFRSHRTTCFNKKKIIPLLILRIIYERNMNDYTLAALHLVYFLSGRKCKISALS